MKEDKSCVIHLDCECHSPEHIVRYSFYDWGTDDMPEFFVEVQACHYLPWYKRVWAAIKYAVGYDGVKWHDAIIKRKDVDVLQKMLSDYKIAYDTYFEEMKKNEK